MSLLTLYELNLIILRLANSDLPLSYGRVHSPELGDKLASPAGWHALPWNVDPSTGEDVQDALRAQGMIYITCPYSTPNGEYTGEFWRATNTTWGNNVFAHENWEGRSSWVNNHRPEGMLVGECLRVLVLIFIFVNRVC